MQLNLNGKVALVTASSGGIGLAIASSLAAEGARVAVNGRTKQNVDKALATIRTSLPDADLIPLVADNGTAAGCETTIAELNVRFLGGEGPTDVLSFPLDEELPPGGRQPDQGGRGPGSPSDPGEPPALLGDVIVCPTVAGRQALERGIPSDDEIALLVVHGVLHLLDYDHAEPDEEKEMFDLQRKLLEEWVGEQVQAYHQDRQIEKDRRLLDKSQFFDEP